MIMKCIYCNNYRFLPIVYDEYQNKILYNTTPVYSPKMGLQLYYVDCICARNRKLYVHKRQYKGKLSIKTIIKQYAFIKRDVFMFIDGCLRRKMRLNIANVLNVCYNILYSKLNGVLV